MDVFVFPLVNVTLFPRTTKPLNIFEARYIEMVKSSLLTQTPIAIGFVDEPLSMTSVTAGEKLNFVHEVAGYGIPQIIEERANGTLLIFLNGVGKVRLGEVKASTTPYIICKSEIISENTQVNPNLGAAIQTLNKVLARWIHTHIADPLQRDIFMKNMLGPEEIVGAFASYMVRDYDLQQTVLEYDDINDKIQFLYRLAQSSEITI